jgi:uncharacterized protein (DUF4415 family)
MSRKKRKRAKKPGKIARLFAVAEELNPLDFIQQWGAYYRPIKKLVTLRVDADVLTWFKKPGPGYQTRINRTLRKAMTEEKKRAGE